MSGLGVWGVGFRVRRELPIWVIVEQFGLLKILTRPLAT